MEIKDASSIYSFLGHLDFFGAIAFCVIITIVISYLLASLTDKIEAASANKFGWLVIGVTSFICLSCLAILIITSHKENDDNADAIAIKAYLTSSGSKYASFDKLSQEVIFPRDLEFSKDMAATQHPRRIEDLKRVISKFPNEFEITIVNDDTTRTDLLGVELIDTNAIKVIYQRNLQLRPYYVAEIAHYMVKHKLKKITYRNIIAKIDQSLSYELLTEIVASSLNKFTPVHEEPGEFALILR